MILRLPRNAPKAKRYAPAVTPLKYALRASSYAAEVRVTHPVLHGGSTRYAPRPRTRVTLADSAYMPAGLPGLMEILSFPLWRNTAVLKTSK